jgi:hypothetical protein
LSCDTSTAAPCSRRSRGSASASLAGSGQCLTCVLTPASRGSGLRYSFDIKNGSVVHEVGVDAKNGQIIENSVERGGH